MKVLKHWPHFHRCQSLKSLLSWLVEVGLARTRWFLEPSGPNVESEWLPTPTLSSREKLFEQGECGKTMERMAAVDGEEEEDDEEEEEEVGLPFLPKDWRDSWRLMASTTVLGTLTEMKRDVFVCLFFFFCSKMILFRTSSHTRAEGETTNNMTI